MTIEIEDESNVYQIRQQKLLELRAQGFSYPNQFKRHHLAASLMADYDMCDKAQLAERAITVAVAGRIVLRRVMGKASFYGRDFILYPDVFIPRADSEVIIDIIKKKTYTSK